MQARLKRRTEILAFLAFFSLWAVHCTAADLPDTVEIDGLAKYYYAVDFDHSMHIDIVESCAACHHHTAGTPAVDEKCTMCHDRTEASSPVACQRCHAPDPFSAEQVYSRERESRRYHVDKPGLKGAYHRSCLGCHISEGAPIGCQDCHERNQLGDSLFKASLETPNAKVAAGGGGGTH